MVRAIQGEHTRTIIYLINIIINTYSNDSDYPSLIRIMMAQG